MNCHSITYYHTEIQFEVQVSHYLVEFDMQKETVESLYE